VRVKRFSMKDTIISHFQNTRFEPVSILIVSLHVQLTSLICQVSSYDRRWPQCSTALSLSARGTGSYGHLRGELLFCLLRFASLGGRNKVP